MPAVHRSPFTLLPPLSLARPCGSNYPHQAQAGRTQTGGRGAAPCITPQVKPCNLPASAAESTPTRSGRGVPFAPHPSGSRSFSVGAVGANWKNARKLLSPYENSAPTRTGGRLPFSGGSGGKWFREGPKPSGPWWWCPRTPPHVPPDSVTGAPTGQPIQREKNSPHPRPSAARPWLAPCPLQPVTRVARAGLQAHTSSSKMRAGMR